MSNQRPYLDVTVRGGYSDAKFLLSDDGDHHGARLRAAWLIIRHPENECKDKRHFFVRGITGNLLNL
jgi:hypothetical protein